MELGIKGKIALVTAASKGIGFAVAKQLAQEGCEVCICSRDYPNILEAARVIEEATSRVVHPYQADVTKQEDIERLTQAITAKFGQLDILVVNAGGPSSGDFFAFSDQDWMQAWELNFMSAVRLSRLAAPGMLERKWGRIVYLTSISVKQPIEGLILSNAVRSAVVGLAKTQALTWGKDNVLVNNVGPGFTRTDRLMDLYQKEAAARGTTLQDLLEEKASSIPLRRMGEPDEIAAVITFLCSEKAGYVTGSSIMVDGGMVKGV